MTYPGIFSHHFSFFVRKSNTNACYINPRDTSHSGDSHCVCVMTIQHKLAKQKQRSLHWCICDSFISPSSGSTVYRQWNQQLQGCDVAFDPRLDVLCSIKLNELLTWQFCCLLRLCLLIYLSITCMYLYDYSKQALHSFEMTTKDTKYYKNDCKSLCIYVYMHLFFFF